jgi:hypothetical protein
LQTTKCFEESLKRKRWLLLVSLFTSYFKRHLYLIRPDILYPASKDTRKKYGFFISRIFVRLDIKQNHHPMHPSIRCLFLSSAGTTCENVKECPFPTNDSLYPTFDIKKLKGSFIELRLSRGYSYTQ